MLRPVHCLAIAALSAAACIEPSATTAADAPLAPFQSELLDLAYDAASSFPLDPHAKNRARAQQEAFTTALELAQPQRALRYAAGIENWRQGLAYAEYALWAARRGADAAELEQTLGLAAAIADDPAATAEQDWRRARIRVRIAETWLLLGDTTRAAEYLQGANAAEAGAIGRTSAQLADADSFDRQVTALDEVILAGDFDAVQHALAACVALYDRFYADVERRKRAEDKVIASWAGTPADVNLRMRMGLAEAALRHGDSPHALALVEQAQELFSATAWSNEDRIRFRAELAGLRHRAGDRARAREEAEAARLAYDLSRDEIVDVFRAETLLPLAAAFHALDDEPAALALYRRALEESQINPNSRPRCDDLVAICVALAVEGLQPDAALMESLRDARRRLGAPW